jgi:hypothetical protein
MTPCTFRQDVKSGGADHSEFPDINRNMIGVYFTKARLH